jgi:hypothetical protein
MMEAIAVTSAPKRTAAKNGGRLRNHNAAVPAITHAGVMALFVMLAASGGPGSAVDLLSHGGAGAGLTGAAGAAAQAPHPPPTSLFARATEIDVRLGEALNATTAREDDRLEVVTVRQVITDRGVEIPAGSLLSGLVTGVRSPTEITVRFNRFIVSRELYFVTGGITEVLDSRGSAITGVQTSSFGELRSTRGPLQLPKGTIFRVRLR